MLQEIRKHYSTHMKTTKGLSTKLKWKEMLMFDDSADVIRILQLHRPELQCQQVTSKKGLTINYAIFEQILMEYHQPWME